MRNLIAATDIVPCLESTQLVRTWPAMVNATDDWIPILGETKSVKGFFVCFFPWMGFTGGPNSARILADNITSRSSKYSKIFMLLNSEFQTIIIVIERTCLSTRL